MMNTYHFHVEITADYPWTVEDVEFALEVIFPSSFLGDDEVLPDCGLTIRPYDPEHPSLRGYRHGHLPAPAPDYEPLEGTGETIYVIDGVSYLAEDLTDELRNRLTVQEQSSNVTDEREVA